MPHQTAYGSGPVAPASLSISAVPSPLSCQPGPWTCDFRRAGVPPGKLFDVGSCVPDAVYAVRVSCVAVVVAWSQRFPYAAASGSVAPEPM